MAELCRPSRARAVDAGVRADTIRMISFNSMSGTPDAIGLTRMTTWGAALAIAVTATCAWISPAGADGHCAQCERKAGGHCAACGPTVGGQDYGHTGCGPRYWGAVYEDPHCVDPCDSCNRWRGPHGVRQGPDLLAPWQLPPGQGFLSAEQVGWVSGPCSTCGPGSAAAPCGSCEPCGHSFKHFVKPCRPILNDVRPRVAEWAAWRPPVAGFGAWQPDFTELGYWAGSLWPW